MTGQIDDRFYYRRFQYNLAGISEGELFDPAELGLAPRPATTACWRGYRASYAVHRSRLVLSSLLANLELEDAGSEIAAQGPVINGVSPAVGSHHYDTFNCHYKGLKYPLDYTGGLLLAKGFIEELYEHMGFQAPWKYERVIELVFHKGVLDREFDRSAEMAEIRARILTARGDEHAGWWPEDQGVIEWIQRAFDRRYY